MAAYMQRRAQDSGDMVQCHHPRLEQLMDIEAQCLPPFHKRAASPPADEASLWRDLELESTFASISQVGAPTSAGIPPLNHLLIGRLWLAPSNAGLLGLFPDCPQSLQLGIQHAVATSQALWDMVLDGTNCSQPSVMLITQFVDAGAGQGGSTPPGWPKRGRPWVTARFSG